MIFLLQFDKILYQHFLHSSKRFYSVALATKGLIKVIVSATNDLKRPKGKGNSEAINKDTHIKLFWHNCNHNFCHNLANSLPTIFLHYSECVSSVALATKGLVKVVVSAANNLETKRQRE